MKSKSRKPARAVTTLTKIETLLADVLEEFSMKTPPMSRRDGTADAETWSELYARLLG